MTSSNISPVRADEYVQWKTCFEAFAAHMSTTLPDKQYEASWARIHPPSGKAPEMWCIVARDEDGSIVGLTHYMMLARSWKETREIYLEGIGGDVMLQCPFCICGLYSVTDLFVMPSARGKKYGKALILAVAEAGAAHGSDAMHWTTGVENVWSARMYDRIAHFGHRWYSMDLPYKPREEGKGQEI